MRLECPNCHQAFDVDGAQYAALLGQVKNQEFDAEVSRRVEELHQQILAEQKTATLEKEQDFQSQLHEKEQEIGKKNAEIAKLEEQVKSIGQSKELEFSGQLSQKDIEIQELKNAISSKDNEKKMALIEADAEMQKKLQQKESEITRLQGDVKLAKADAERKVMGLKESYESQLKAKDEQIDYYKDFKARLSTKMIGESLEVHCYNEFSKVRAITYPQATCEKDNDTSTGSKGDFIFRDFADGREYISIMFEMKNEADTTSTKHKNEDFLEKLDKDRREKKCEYAVLVSLLEADSELYNQGIVDMSFRYPKMFVVRPQFFMPLIALLVQASKKTVDLQHELAEAKSQSLDVTNFEAKLISFKDAFTKYCDKSSEKKEKAIDDIDRAIGLLQKIKDEMIASEKALQMANNKLEGLTIKKLVRGNQTMKALLDEAHVEEVEALPVNEEHEE